MYQSPLKNTFIFLGGLMGSLSVFAESPHIGKNYADYKESTKSFFEAKLEKKDFKQKISEQFKKLNGFYVSIIESEDLEGSIPGDQVAYELGLWDPLVELAESELTNLDCQKAASELRRFMPEGANPGTLGDHLKKLLLVACPDAKVD